MKKVFIFLLITILAVTASACSGQIEAPAEVLPVEGYEYYTNSADEITFQYPDEWIEVSADVANDPEVLDELERIMEMPRDMLINAFSQVNATFYDMSYEGEDVIPNMNYVIAASPGANQEQLKNPASAIQIKQEIETEYQRLFSGFSWDMEPKSVKFGNNEFICLISNYTMGQMSVTCYQAMTVHKEKIYTFTYTAEQGRFSEDMISTIETVLSTVEFAV